MASTVALQVAVLAATPYLMLASPAAWTPPDGIWLPGMFLSFLTVVGIGMAVQKRADGAALRAVRVTTGLTAFGLAFMVVMAAIILWMGRGASLP